MSDYVFSPVVRAMRRRRFDAKLLMRRMAECDGQLLQKVDALFNQDIMTYVIRGDDPAEWLHKLCDQFDQRRVSDEGLLLIITIAERYDECLASYVALEILKIYETKVPIGIPKNEHHEHDMLYIRSRMEYFYSSHSKTIRKLNCRINKQDWVEDDEPLDEFSILPRIKYTGTMPGNVSKFFGRDDCKLKLKEAISALFFEACGAIVVHGTGGIGKTTLVQHIVQDKRLLRMISADIEAVAWLNICDLTMAQTFDSTAFLQRLIDVFDALEIFGQVQEPSPNILAIQKALHKAPVLPKILLVLDDTFCRSALRLISQIAQGKEFLRCIAISRNPQLAVYQHDGAFSCKAIELDHLTELQIQQLLGDHYKLVVEKGLTAVQVAELAKICHGLPLIASVIASQFRNLVNGSETIKDVYSKLVYGNRITQILRQPMEVDKMGYSRRSEMTLAELMLHSPDFNDPFFNKMIYHTFLLFSPGEFVDANDLKVLWHCTSTAVVAELCQPAVAASLLRPAGNFGDGYVVHDLLHKAVGENAKLTADKATDDALKSSIISFWIRHEPKHPKSNMLVDAIEQRDDAKKVLQLMVKHTETELLVELATSRSETSSAIPLVLLAEYARDDSWIRQNGCPNEFNLASQFFCIIANMLAQMHNDTHVVFPEFLYKSIQTTMLGDGVGKWHSNLFLTAAKGRHIELTKLLVNNASFDHLVNNKDEDGNNALLLGANFSLIVMAIVDSQKFDVNLQNKRGETALMLCSFNPDWAKDIARMLSSSQRSTLNVNLTDKNGDTALHWAVKQGRLELVKYLVEDLKADIHSRNILLMINPLEGAITCHRSSKIAQYLFDKGAGVSEANFVRGVKITQTLKNFEMLRFLSDNEFQLLENYRNRPSPSYDAIDNLSTPVGHFEQQLIGCASNGDFETIEKMLNAGDWRTEIDARDGGGNTPLIVAGERNHYNIVEMLLDHGADANSQNEYGMTVLIVTCDRGYYDIVRLLVSKRCDLKIDSVNSLGETALFRACAMRHFEIAKLLVEDAAASVNVRIHDGATALCWAVHHGDYATVELLLQNGADQRLVPATRFSTMIEFAKFKNHLKVAALLEEYY